MKIVAVDCSVEYQRRWPNEPVDYFVVEDDTWDPQTREYSGAWMLSTDGHFRPVLNGTSHLDHVTWYDHPDDRELLHALLASAGVKLPVESPPPFYNRSWGEYFERNGIDVSWTAG